MYPEKSTSEVFRAWDKSIAHLARMQVRKHLQVNRLLRLAAATRVIPQDARNDRVLARINALFLRLNTEINAVRACEYAMHKAYMASLE